MAFTFSRSTEIPSPEMMCHNEFSSERRNILTIFHTIDFPLSKSIQPLGALHAPFHSLNTQECRPKRLAQIGPNTS